MTDWKRENKESHKTQIFISRRMRTERTQSDDVEDIHSNIYQFEIIDRQWLEEKTETLNKWKLSTQRDHHIRKHYIESSSQEVKNKWVEVNINHINFSIIFFWRFYKWSKHIANAQKCHDPSLARLSLLALPGLSSLRHLD